MRVIRTDLPQPTWNQGFARKAHQSLYPQFWKGLVAAWCPGLGPTGGTLREIVGLEPHHGTLTNFSSGSDWLPQQGRYTLDYSSTDYVDAESVYSGILDGDMTYSAWVRVDSVASDRYISHIGTAAANEDYLVFFLESTTSGILTVLGRVGAVGSAAATYPTALTVGTWYLATYVRFKNGAGTPSVIVYLNGDPGTEVTDGEFGAILGSTAEVNLIGAFRTGVATFDGAIDDVLIHNRALTEQEIRLLYKIGRGGIFYERQYVVARSFIRPLVLPPASTSIFKDYVIRGVQG